MILMATKNSSNANKRLNLGRGFSYDTQDRLLYNENKNIVLTRTEQ